MEICKKCGGIAEWNSYYGGITCTRCGHVEKPKTTNYDRLINKTPEEMAEHYNNRGCPPNKRCPVGTELRDIRINDVCTKCWLDWLRQEADDAEN